MAFPTTTVLETFAGGAQSPPNASWTNSIVSTEGTFQRDGAGLGALATGSNATAWWNAGTFTDVECFQTVSVKAGSGNPIKLFARIVSPGSATPNGYVLKMREAAGAANDGWEIVRIDAGVDTVLGAIPTQEVTAGDLMGFTVYGSTLEAWYKPAAGAWTLISSRTDSTYSAAGVIGTGISFSTGRVDDFGGGNIVSGGTYLQPYAGHGWHSRFQRGPGNLQFFQGTIGKYPLVLVGSTPAAVFGQSLDANVTSTATISKVIAKLMPANVTSTATLIKSMSKSLLATVTSTATIRKSMGKPMTANATVTATMNKSIAKRLTATVTSTATLSAKRALLLSMTATVTSTALIATVKQAAVVVVAAVGRRLRRRNRRAMY